ncbi:MAG: NHL repeat-containing protein [Candidatus Aminicenantes bacterium]|nr:NHL repeat-containing protein [Candidatus Aminicenantes bacterium]
MKRLLAISVLGGFILFVPTRSYSQKIENKTGVRIVHNEKGGTWGANPAVSLTLVRTYGDIDIDDPNLAFNQPSDVAMDAGGNVYVLDAMNQRIQKFGPDGKYLATIGRKGQGPGEFNYPSSLDIGPTGSLYVLESMQKKILVLSPEGRELRTIRTLNDMVMKIRHLNSGMVAGGIYLGFGRGASEQRNKKKPKLIKIYDLDGKTKQDLADAFDFGDEFSTSSGNISFFDADKDDNLYLSFFNQNRIEKYSPKGILLWTADRPLNYSTEMLEKGTVERSERGTSMQAPRFNTCSIGIAVDEKERAWVITLNRQLKKEEQVGTIMTGGSGGVSSVKTMGDRELQKTDAFKLEVFDTDGGLLGEVPLEHFVSAIRIFKDNLFLIDVERRAKIYHYKIIEK